VSSRVVRLALIRASRIGRRRALSSFDEDHRPLALLAAALLLVAQLDAGVQVKGFGAAMIAALVLGLFNTLLRPVLVLLTLPVTVLTLGLFFFVINALMFYLAAAVLDGFQVTSFWAALLGSLLYTLCGLVIDAAMERIFSASSR
jgi:putative membrane protein